MEKAFYVHLQNYAPLLKAERLAFKEDEKCFFIGGTTPGPGYAIFISCCTRQTPELLKIILPFLKSVKAAFRLIKNQTLQYRLNAGAFGENECGKVLSIFPTDHEQLREWVAELCKCTLQFKGPAVTNAQRTGEIVYIQQVALRNGETVLSHPDIKRMPVDVPKRYRRRQRNNAILGGGFLPIQMIRSSPKGNIYKAINLKKLAFDWCLVKQGNPVALDDHFDRDMRDRLLWQREVILSLQDEICTPAHIDYFERQGSSYLVTGFIEGQSLGHRTRELLSGGVWLNLPGAQKQSLLDWYLQALALVQKIHEKGYVHRDITDSNFMILDSGQLCVIDFELAYSLHEQRPNPPFLLGTYGYAAPEQLEYAVPDVKEDVYSLGALLAFLLTGCSPNEFLNTTNQIVKAKLSRLTGSPQLAAAVIRCLALSRKDRPNINWLAEQINNYCQTLTNTTHENKTMDH